MLTNQHTSIQAIVDENTESTKKNLDLIYEVKQLKEQHEEALSLLEDQLNESVLLLSYIKDQNVCNTKYTEIQSIRRKYNKLKGQNDNI